MNTPDVEATIIVAATTAAKTDPTAAISDLTRWRQLIDDLTRDYVMQARGAGRSWAQIARVLGVSPQSAHSKFASR